MTRWFNSLTMRERVLLVGLVPLAVMFGLFQFAWVPLQQTRAAHLTDIAAYRLVSSAAARLQADPAPITVPAPTDPIATRVTQSAESAGLQLRRLEPDGTGLRVTLDEVPFQSIMLWMLDMEANFAVRVAAIELDRRPAPGAISARLLLEDMQ